jgi:hypothetical protein
MTTSGGFAPAEPDMDRRERRRLKDDINRGNRNIGIYKVEEGAYEKESRLPVVKGGSIGFGLGGAAAVAYGRHVGLDQTPLGLFLGDYVLVMFGLVAAGTVLGALLARPFSKAAPIRGKSPGDTP